MFTFENPTVTGRCRFFQKRAKQPWKLASLFGLPNASDRRLHASVHSSPPMTHVIDTTRDGCFSLKNISKTWVRFLDSEVLSVERTFYVFYHTLYFFISYSFKFLQLIQDELSN